MGRRSGKDLKAASIAVYSLRSAPNCTDTASACSVASVVWYRSSQSTGTRQALRFDMRRPSLNSRSCAPVETGDRRHAGAYE